MTQKEKDAAAAKAPYTASAYEYAPPSRQIYTKIDLKKPLEWTENVDQLFNITAEGIYRTQLQVEEYLDSSANRSLPATGDYRVYAKLE